MLSRLTLKIAAAAAVSLSAALFVAEASPGQRRRPASRRATNPVEPRSAQQPDPDEPRLVSSADEQEERETPRTARDRRNRQQQGQQQQQQADESRRAIEQLTDELTRLNRKVDDIEKQRRVDLVMERLARAEQRAEAVQAQLRDTMEKEANLQARLDQLEDQSRPENIDRQIALVGSFRPDAERDRLRAQYENEKRRTRELIDVNARQRQRLEASLATADQMVERLRAQLDDETRRELEAEAAGGGTVVRPAAATPTPTPTPPTR
jgi:predicted RNase H-like nuclease (RuvC/YqgF family)